MHVGMHGFSSLNLDVMLVVQPVLVLESEEAVAELMQLKTMPITGTDTVGFCLIPFLASCVIPSTAGSCTCIVFWSLACLSQQGLLC